MASSIYGSPPGSCRESVHDPILTVHGHGVRLFSHRARRPWRAIYSKHGEVPHNLDLRDESRSRPFQSTVPTCQTQTSRAGQDPVPRTHLWQIDELCRFTVGCAEPARVPRRQRPCGQAVEHDAQKDRPPRD